MLLLLPSFYPEYLSCITREHERSVRTRTTATASLVTLFSFRISTHERADRSEPTCVSVDGGAKTDAREQCANDSISMEKEGVDVLISGENVAFWLMTATTLSMSD